MLQTLMVTLHMTLEIIRIIIFNGVITLIVCIIFRIDKARKI